jgi:hypothetical protein
MGETQVPERNVEQAEALGEHDFTRRLGLRDGGEAFADARADGDGLSPKRSTLARQGHERDARDETLRNAHFADGD